MSSDISRAVCSRKIGGQRDDNLFALHFAFPTSFMDWSGRGAASIHEHASAILNDPVLFTLPSVCMLMRM